jgi:MFS family permease
MLKKHLNNYFYDGDEMPRNIFISLLSSFVYALGYSSVMFLPLYLKHSLGYSIQKTGVILGVFGVAFILGSFYGGKLCDRFSPYRVARVSIFLYFIVAIMAYFFPRPEWLLLIILFFLGLSISFFSPASRIYLMEITPKEKQISVNGIRYMVMNVGIAISCGIAGIVAAGNYNRIFILSSVSGVAAFLVFSKLKPLSLRDKEEKLSTRPNLWKEKFILVSLVSFFLSMLVFNQTGSSYSLFLTTQFHFTSHDIALLFIVNSLVITFFQVPILKIFGQLQQFLLMSIGSIILGTGFFILIFSHIFIVTIISMLLITIGEMLFMPISQTLIFQSARESERGFYVGVYQALYASTFVLSPLIGTFVLSLNPSGKLLWTGSLALCCIPLFLFITAVRQNK